MTEHTSHERRLEDIDVASDRLRRNTDRIGKFRPVENRASGRGEHRPQSLHHHGCHGYSQRRNITLQKGPNKLLPPPIPVNQRPKTAPDRGSGMLQSEGEIGELLWAFRLVGGISVPAVVSG